MQINFTASNVQASAIVTAPKKDIPAILFGELSSGVLHDAFEAIHMAGVGIAYREQPGYAKQFICECVTQDLLTDAIRIDDYFDVEDLNEMRAAYLLANIEAEAEAGRREVREAFAKLADMAN